jgi:hypothetical protein
VARRALMPNDPAPSDSRLLLRFFGHALRKTALILAIPAVITIAYIVCLRRVGELLPASRIAALSLLPERLVWLTGYYDTGRLHKADVARIIAPEVVVVGTSRAMQIRAEFFDKVSATAFYNAGGCCQTAFAAQRTIHELLAATRKPKLILLGIEPSWFQSSSPGPSSRRAMFGSLGRPLASEWASFQDDLSAMTDRVQVLQLAWRDPRFQSAATVRFAPAHDTALNAKLVGVSARTTRGGFRNDGSLRYGDLVLKQEDSVDTPARAVAFRRTMIEDIDRRGGSGGRYLVDDDVRTLELIFEETRAAGVQLVAFVTPVSPTGISFLDRFADDRAFTTDFQATIGAMCARHGVPFFDAYDGRTVNATDADFYDWLHPSERLVARLMVAMYADPRAGELLRSFGDGNHLAAAIVASEHRWRVYEY